MENIIELLTQNLSSVLALVGTLILIIFVLYTAKIEFTTKMLINISLLLAMSVVLHYIKIYHFPQGGSVTPGAMIPLILIALRYGAGVGALAGFIFGLINILQDPFILHPIQVLFDYPLPYMAMGLAGIFGDKIILSAIAAFIGRYICHFVSGVVFFASYAPEGMSPIIYSLMANATYLLPESIICCIILKVLPIKRLLAAMKE